MLTVVEMYRFFAVSGVLDFPVLSKSCAPAGSQIKENNPYKFEVITPSRLSMKYFWPLKNIKERRGREKEE